MGSVTTIIMVLAIVAACLGLVLRRMRGRGHWRPCGLRERYKRMLHMPEDMAEAVIEAQLSRLRERHPGRSEQWYLEKMLYDLQRDRR